MEGMGMEAEGGEGEPFGMLGPRPDRRPTRPARTQQGEAETDTAVAWMFTSEDLLRTWCERLFAAAQAGNYSASGDQASMPVETHPKAEVVAEYHLDWPSAVGNKLTGVSADPLTIHYVRTQLRAKASVVRGFYSRKLSSGIVRELPDGLWVESCRPDPETGRRRSIDVLITTTESLKDRPRTDEIEWTVQLLVIEIKDPGPKRDAAGAAQ